MGWLDALGALGKSGSDQIDRFYAMRQLNNENGWTAFQNALKFQQAQQDQAVKDRQLQQLDMAIMNAKQNQFTNLHNPGSILSPEDLSAAQGIGLGGLVQHQNATNPGFDVTPSIAPGVADVSTLTPNDDGSFKNWGVAPTALPGQAFSLAPRNATPAQDIFQGTPGQQDDQQDRQLKMLQSVMPFIKMQQDSQFLQGFDPTNPRDIAWLQQHGDPGASLSDFVRTPGSQGSDQAQFLDKFAKDLGLPDRSALSVDQQVQGMKKYKDATQTVAPGMSPDAIEGMITLAQQGVMPSFGMNNAGGRNSFYEAVNARNQGLNPVDTVGGKADAASFKNIQSMADTVGTFHKLADANGQLAVDTFKKMVDGGAPILNTPIRALAKQFGDPATAAANIAAGTFAREYGRLTTNPQMKGQFTDSAREDAQHMMDGSYTVGQFLAAYDIAQKDLSNVDTSVGQQLGEIRDRINQRTGQNIKTPQGQQGGNQTIKMITPKGDIVDVPINQVQDALAHNGKIYTGGGGS